MLRLNIFCSQKKILLLILLISIRYTGNIYSAPSPDSATTSEYQISGIITDLLTEAVIGDARISLLDPLTGNVLHTGIYTDKNGSYDTTVNLNFTSVHTRSSEVFSFYQISEFYPNPVVLRNNETLKIRYQVPGNVPDTPMFEMYDIFGKRVNHKSFLASGTYICRLRFNNGRFSGSKKLMLTTGGFLNISLNRVSGNRDQALKTAKPDVSYTNKTGHILDVLFLIEKSGYAGMERSGKLVEGTNNVTDFSMVQIDNQSIVTLDTTGGTITVANSRNDSITLTIPRYALWEPTTITLSTFDTQPKNPISKNIFPGINISPGGFRPHRPVSLKVVFATTEVDTNLSTLFYIKQSDFVLPIGKTAVTDSSIEGEIYHFSDFAGGNPSGNEVTNQADKAADGGALNPYDWQNTYEVVEALIRWAEILQRLGREAEAEKVLNKMRKIVERDAGNFLNQPVPDDPCGKYRDVFVKFGELVFSVLVYGDLVDAYSDRVGELFNQCGIQGDIVCHYDIEHVAAAYYDRWIVDGIIPIIGDKSELGRFAGYGTSNVIVTGQANEAAIIGSGTNTISLSGELTVDSQGDFWLEVDWTEEWWTASIWTFFPPDAPPFTISQPPHTDLYKLRFPATSGSTVQLPYGYTWFLNLYNLFND